LIERIDPIVSDQRISHRDDLPTIRWVGQYFLITGHGGAETNFADAGTGCAKGFALEIQTVLEGSERANVTMHYQTGQRIFKSRFFDHAKKPGTNFHYRYIKITA